MATIDSVIARAAATAPERIAVREWNAGRAMTYSQLDTAVSRFAAWVRTSGVQDGQAIAIHLPNSAYYLIAQFGTFRAGGVAAYVNYRLSSAEAQRQFRLCEARVIVTTAAKAMEFRRMPEFAEVVFVVVGDEDVQSERMSDIVNTDHVFSHDVEGRDECDAIIRFTSGSTGSPKGLIVSHRAWLIRAVSMLAEEMPITPYSTTLLLGQLSHQAGLFVIPTFLRGGTVLMIEKFDLGSLAQVLTTQHISCAQIVPTMFSLILNDHNAREAFRNSGLDRIVYGGSPIRQVILDQVLALLPKTEFVQSYGSHEAGSISCLDGPGHHHPELRNSAGRPLLTAQVRIRRDAGESVGEIEVKAPWVPHARLTEKGREPISEAWSPTGDVGEIVDGHIFLRDRMNDVIISGGFNVYPLEVEKVIDAHPSILDSAVGSAPDDKWGERVVAFVVVRGGTAPFDEAALREHCKGLLAGYKVPKEFHVITEIPVNANGKPDRRKLGQPLWEGRERRIN